MSSSPDWKIIRQKGWRDTNDKLVNSHFRFGSGKEFHNGWPKCRAYPLVAWCGLVGKAAGLENATKASVWVSRGSRVSPGLGGLNNRHVLSYSSGGHKSELMAGLAFSGGSGGEPPPGLFPSFWRPQALLGLQSAVTLHPTSPPLCACLSLYPYSLF